MAQGHVTMDLNFSQTGQGNPLVIMHGLLGSSRNWGGIATGLAANHRVLTVDMPNHGASPWSETMDYPFMAREIDHFIKQHAAGRAAVVGHSMGGKAAMALALSKPERVERLLVLDIAPVPYTHTFAPYIKAMRAAPINTALRRGDVELAMHGVIDDPRVRAFLMQNLEGSPGSYRWRPNLAVLGAAMSDILSFPHIKGRYDGPALFLYGADSDYVLPEHHAKIQSLFPNARFKAVPKAGHWVHADQPQVFLQELQSFLSE